MSLMAEYKFDCNTHRSPAYTCSRPGDNSGIYYSKEEVDECIRKLKLKMEHEKLMAMASMI